VKENSIYVHINKPPVSNRVLLRPIDVLPVKAILLNTGEELDTSIECIPSLYKENKGYLRIRNIPVNLHENTVMIIRLDFEKLPDNNYMIEKGAHEADRVVKQIMD
jgi:alpha-L-fucosidase